MYRKLEDWELKYIKSSISKRFSFWKWEINFSFGITNKMLNKIWKKRIKKFLPTTTSDKDFWTAV